MTRTRPVRSTTARRRLATVVAAGAVAAGGVAALPASASATGLSTTISRWTSADFALNDPANTTLTVAAGIDDVGVVGKKLTSTTTISVKINQSRCTTGPGGDVLVTRALAVEKPASGATVNPLSGSASVKTTIGVTGTETSTPAGTGGTCATPDPAAATTTPISDTVKLNVSWKNAPGSSPVTWADIWQQGVFYYRDATAKGQVESASTGPASLSGSTSGWLWSGAWVYATGT